MKCRIPDGKAPRFPKKPTIRQEGDLLIMECVLEAHPVPEITWFQGQKAITDSTRVRMSRISTGKDTYLLTLEITNPTKADGGNYRCNAFNTFGESNANISLNFQGKFKLRERLNSGMGKLIGYERNQTQCMYSIENFALKLRSDWHNYYQNQLS